MTACTRLSYQCARRVCICPGSRSPVSSLSPSSGLQASGPQGVGRKWRNNHPSRFRPHQALCRSSEWRSYHSRCRWSSGHHLWNGHKQVMSRWSNMWFEHDKSTLTSSLEICSSPPVFHLEPGGVFGIFERAKHVSAHLPVAEEWDGMRELNGFCCVSARH